MVPWGVLSVPGWLLRSVVRKCGSCQLCCVLPAIKALGKPANVPCKHLTEKGCGIYNSRPQVCREFRCHWLDGKGDERPDVIGAYTSRIPSGDGWGVPMTGMLVHLDPSRPGRHVAVQKAINETVKAGGEAVMFRGESRRIATNNPRTLALAALKGLQDQDGRNVIVERP